jgi:hypothetical protein
MLGKVRGSPWPVHIMLYPTLFSSIVCQNDTQNKQIRRVKTQNQKIILFLGHTLQLSNEFSPCGGFGFWTSKPPSSQM